MKDWPNTGRTVTILKVTNGYIVKIGCRQFVFKDYTALLTALAAYFNDPIKTENMWLEEYGQERKDKILENDSCGSASASGPSGEPGL